MADTRFHVAGIGNAIVDVLVHADDALLSQLDLTKGVMTLIDSATAESIYERLPPRYRMLGWVRRQHHRRHRLAGGKAAYVGKVKNDQLGQVFRHDIRSAGITFDTAPAEDGNSTARCFVLVTPDAQRTMLTYLGACVELTPDDVDEAIIASSAVTYLEGYLYDPPAAKRAFLAAASVAHGAGRMVSLSLSDPFCVDRHRVDFADLVANHVDILFANEAELCSLYQTDNFDDAIRASRGHCRVAAITRGAKGSVVIAGEDAIVVGAAPVAQVVDTTGAGDLYAAGFLHGFTQGRDLATCALLGGIAAGEVISHFGARPERPLAQLAAETLGLPSL